MNALIVVAVLVVLLVLFSVTCIKIVPQASAMVVERLGSYLTTWQTGLHIKIPFIDRVRSGISLKEQVFDFPPQPVITKDNVTMSIDTVVFFQIMDPKLYCYGVENPIIAIENLSATTLRNIVGDLDLDTTLTSRDVVNSKMRAILDEATDAWGIKVNRVEVKNITPPAAIQQAMEKQMKAEREKREAVLLAEGEKQAAITIAEGNKQAMILAAEAHKQQVILSAEADKEKQIREAEGEADAIRNVQMATADGIRVVREAGADNAVLTLKALEALGALATKLIVPSDIQGIAGLAASLKEVFVDDPSVKPSKSAGQDQ
ncbi:MAG: stomatin-like protein [Raoultibacter sp.]